MHVGIAHLCEVLLHDLWAVVDRKDDVSDTSGSESLDLVEDHALVSELNQWLWESEGLRVWSDCRTLLARRALWPLV